MRKGTGGNGADEGEFSIAIGEAHLGLEQLRTHRTWSICIFVGFEVRERGVSVAIEVAVGVGASSKASHTFDVLSIKRNPISCLRFGLEDNGTAILSDMAVHATPAANQIVREAVLGEVALLIAAETSHN